MTEEEANEFYGADAAEWLKRWNDGGIVWSVEMGGFGPGYEQALQITAARMIGWLVANKPDASQWEDRAKWTETRERMEAEISVEDLGLSGAQWGAAMQIATRFYRDGPAKALNDPSLDEDRKIQISREFPVEQAAVA